ncbi:hypothetical protein PPGU19_075990 (plasmid) [Paraburkholderia sp. PGU19]|nr:hypothetical protein PPGU19_075990 [Paraburkholderia sp. PGU19]
MCAVEAYVHRSAFHGRLLNGMQSCSVGRGDPAFKHRKDYVSGEATVGTSARMKAIHGACLPGAVVVMNWDGPRVLPADTITESASGIRRRERLRVYAQLPPKKILHCGSVLHLSATRLPACVFVAGIPPYD